MDSSTVLLNPDDVLVHPKNWTEIPSHVAHLYSAQHPVVAVYTIQGRQHAVLVGAGWASERACSYLDAPGTKFYKQIINPKCSKPIMQPQYTKIFGQLGRDLSVEPLFLMAIALQESGWDLVHVFGTNSSSKGQPLNNLFGLTKAGGNNIAFSTVEASAEYWKKEWGPYISDKPKTIEAFVADLVKDKKHMYNSSPGYPGEIKKRYEQLQDATEACGTTF